MRTVLPPDGGAARGTPLPIPLLAGGGQRASDHAYGDTAIEGEERAKERPLDAAMMAQ
jgi:hypothetical protein